jgi:tyrosine decarboxylase/aspartate 1-decarboxylase
MENSMYLHKRLLGMKAMEPVAAPEMNVLGLRPSAGSGLDAADLAKALRGRGWALSLFPGFLRITVMPHVSRVMIDHFLDDLEEIRV